MKIIRALGKWFTSDLKESGKPPSKYTKIHNGARITTGRGQV